MGELRLLSLNCRGLGSPEKRRDVLDYLKTLQYDLFLLQDTHLTKRKVSFFNTLWPGKCYHSFGTFNSRGTSILFNPQTQHRVIQEEHCTTGNYNIITCQMFLNTYTIINVYGPNDDRPSFFHQINQKLNETVSENVIIAGDFNFVIDYQRDSNYLRQNNPAARDAFLSLIEEQNLVDAWTELNPGKRTFTWAKGNPYKFGRLDMFFISEHLITQTVSSSVLAGYRSDHCIITLNLSVAEKKKGPGLWKLNESLLKDENYDKAIKSVIVNAVKQYAVPAYSDSFLSNEEHFNSVQFTISDCLFYETLLMLIRGETVRYSKRKARSRRKQELQITNKISQLRTEVESQPNPTNLERLEEAQKSLEDIRKPRIEGMIIRSKVSWYEEGEKSSKYFLSLEKRNAARNTVQYLRIDNKVVANQETILNLFSENLRNKYSYSHLTADKETFLERNIIHKLSQEQKTELDTPLSLNELYSAVRQMKKGKSPGANGLTADFFKHFWPFLGTFLYRAWLEKFSNSKNIGSHNLGIVTLIPKTGNQHDSIKGWRPITLLNVDFKIISAAVTNRLKSVIQQLISPSQTAYIQGRFIGENSRVVYDIIEHLNNSSSSGIITAIDFESAFDTVSWEFLSTALDKYNFGPYFQNLINVLYLNPDLTSRISLNGFLGPEVRLKRGIRQGDPISGYLFNLIVEPLANQLNQSTLLKGIRISSQTEIRTSQYADDLVLFSDPEPHSMKGIIDELGSFSDVSGLKLNLGKTKCLPIGNDINETAVTELGFNYC